MHEAAASCAEAFRNGNAAANAISVAESGGGMSGFASVSNFAQATGFIGTYAARVGPDWMPISDRGVGPLLDADYHKLYLSLAYTDQNIDRAIDLAPAGFRETA